MRNLRRHWFFFAVSIIQAVPHTHLHLHVDLTETNRQSRAAFQKSKALSEIGEHGIEKYFQSIFTGKMVTRNNEIVGSSNTEANATLSPG
jgi:hypothetical protein